MSNKKNPERFSDVPTVVIRSKCSTCKHKEEGEPYCKAFPQGIPLVILDGDVKHVAPYPGDRGIQYEAE